MKHYFLSDAHLFPRPEPHPGREPLLAFLRQLAGTEAGALWILGDLFDFWFEFGGSPPAGHRDILDSLLALTDAGWTGRIIPGNHDHWLGDGFARATGFEIIPDRSLVRIAGKGAFLAHGDALGRGDIGYRLILRPLVRARVSRLLFGLLGAPFGLALARLASGTSRRILRRELEELPPGLVEWVDSELRSREDLDVIMTGHAHVPLLRNTGHGIHVSLGDWLMSFTYAILDESGGRLRLHRFDVPAVDRSRL